MITIAVLMTCHNRKATTLASLGRLSAQSLPPLVRLDVFLTDDGSTDGTAEGVLANHPHVHVLNGDGTLYWTGGTLRSEGAALRTKPDYLMWLNDDVQLDSSAVADLLDIAKRGAVAVGALREPGTHSASYGGYHNSRPGIPFPQSRAEPMGEAQAIDTMNGNVVLFPVSVRRAVGALDPRLRHNMADMDYGLRCARAGVPLLLTPGFVGSCAGNPSKSGWGDPTTPLAERVRSVLSFRGLPPKQWLIFTRRHCGWRWPRYFVGPYLRTLLVGLRPGRVRPPAL